jgi:hypothetical protein
VPSARSSLQTLREFAARHREGAPAAADEFPERALRALGPADGEDDVASLLVELAALARRYPRATTARGGEAYQGEDLLRLAAVADGIAGLGRRDVRLIQLLVELLSLGQREAYGARPGSPDPDKLDRDEAVERAEDLLALSALRALDGMGGAAAEAALEVERCERHRSADVRHLAWPLSARLGRGSIAVSGSIGGDGEGDGGAPPS